MQQTVAVYTRISSDPNGLRLGVERQREDCLALSSRLYPDVPVTVYEDNDVSAWSGKPRPQYEMMIRNLKDLRHVAVVVYNIDRLTRQPRELEQFIDDCTRVSFRNIHTVEGDVDLSRPDGQLVARIMGAVARKESDDKSRRIRRAWEQRAKEGKVHGGKRPFGYQRADGRLVIEPREAQVIRDAVQYVIAGGSLPGALSILSTVPGALGGTWRLATARNVLTAPRIAGLRVHNGRVIGDGDWPAIITRAEHEFIVSRFKPRAGGPVKHRAKRKWWLTGIAVCHNGHPLSGRTRRSRGLYVCDASCVTISAGGLEDYCAGAILSVLDTPAFDALHNDAELVESTQLEIATITGRLDVLAANYATGIISLSEWQSARDAITPRLTDLTERLERIQHSNLSLHNARVWFPDATVEQKHTLARMILDRVVVSPGIIGNFTTSRIRCVPRPEYLIRE